METEQEIFDQLSALCAKPGFIHALVDMHFSDNYFKADRKNNFTVSSVSEHEADKSKLNRNEVNTLLALVIKNNKFCYLIINFDYYVNYIFKLE